MNYSLPSVTELESALDSAADIVPPTVNVTRCFDCADWVSFGGTVLVIFSVYLSTPAPEVTLVNAGYYTTGAVYAGVPNPPGFPLWTVYAWLFTVLLPISNFAWRVGVSSAVAAALACGFTALLVSRCSAWVLSGWPGAERLQPRDEAWLRVLSGFVAGMAFGLDRAVWGRALTADDWPLSWLLFALTLCLLFRWHHTPRQMRWLCAAFFSYGLTLVNCQALVLAAWGLACFVLLQNPTLGRDIFALVALVLAAFFCAWWRNHLPDGISVLSQIDILWPAYATVGCFSALVGIGLIVKTRRLFENWRIFCACGLCLMLGLALYLFLPLMSLANPPANWGYPRTVDGFFHVISRGQYEKSNPTFIPSLAQLAIYGHSVIADFGLIYVVLAVVPFCCFCRLRAPERNCLLGLLAIFLSLSLFMLDMLTPSPDRAAQELVKSYYAPSHLILAIFAGIGLVHRPIYTPTATSAP